ncbi:hypothetical protein SAMN05444166_1214 [Singulisphaera sp. GP187]|uniref:hypothetical protein n=1 Tax=Singulisphaera sp. GP187 TaxID=1882752 RepID=UPI000927E023|nr:hypothetical protein [Singulisphaera sp. GP187]SIN84083.1 hypothetical protein SAMN05444166_1214 [Singulisphaera sp. GP187]
MRRVLVIGLTLLVAFAVMVGVRARYQRRQFQQAAVLAAATVDEAEAKPSTPIPQDATALEKQRHDLLAWNRRTLQEAYDRVGKKDPRWDELARKTLDLAARTFSGEVDPQVTFDDVYPAARAAVEAGCDDPMVAYLYARTSVGANDPGPEEGLRRARAAAQGLAASRYPAMRRAVALRFSGGMALSGENPGDSNRKEAQRDFDAALALLEESVASDEHNEIWEANWLNTLIELTRGYRTLDVPAEAAYERVDAGLARVAGAKVLRLIYRGNFWFNYGWEARTQSFAPRVPAGGFDTLEKRLAVAQEAYQDAWKLQPTSGEVARRLLEIDKSVSGDRATMELWFERAMKLNGDDRTTCWSKLDWLDPKWHGSAEDMLAFGRACRDTKNSRTGITLLVADAHWRIASKLGGENQPKYLAVPAVWADIQSVYHEYLKHHPVDDVARSKFATFCYLSGHFREAEVQYVALGDHLTQWSEFPYVPLNQLKRNRAHNATIVMSNDLQIGFPGWHFVGGTNQDGRWKVNIPVGAEHKSKPGILGADASHVWKCTADGITYEIRVLLLADALRNDRPERVLDAARSVVAEERGSQPRNLRDTLLAARPAQEYDIDAPVLKPMQLRVKTAVIGNWLYELSVTASKNDVTGGAAREFFDSFAFQPVPKPSTDADAAPE